MRESDPKAPLTPYCIAKLAGEQLLAFYAERSKFSWIALRFFNVYGPGQQTDAYYTSVVLAFLRRIAAGGAPVIDGSGEQTMDFVHVQDVAGAGGMAVDSGPRVRRSTSVRASRPRSPNWPSHLIRAVGVDVKPMLRPREVLVTQREASIERIKELLGWEPTVALPQGLASVVEHLKLTGELG